MRKAIIKVFESDSKDAPLLIQSVCDFKEFPEVLAAVQYLGVVKVNFFDDRETDYVQI